MKNKVRDGYAQARSNLLIAILFTVINIVLAWMESDTMFLFSATIPYYYAVVAYYWGFMEYYVITAVILLGLLGCWYFSKKSKIGFIIPFIYFIIDAVFMLWMYDFQFDASMILDILFHAWILFYLVGGIMYKEQDEEIENENIVEKEISLEVDDTTDSETSSKYIRIAEDVKARIFLEETVLGRHVVYRRVGTVNELVINGKVYNEYDSLIERPHNLGAYINGHLIEVGITQTSQMYISLDGETIKKKMRWI